MRWLLIALVACSGTSRVALDRAQLGTPAARQVGSFHTEGGHRELTPANIEESNLDDEATLVSDRCVALTVRDDAGAELAAYTPTFVIDGARLPAAISDEKASLLVLPKGQKAEDCEHGIGANVPAYCVYIRSAKLCAPTAGRAIELQLVHPTLVYRSELVDRKTHYALSFAWTVK